MKHMTMRTLSIGYVFLVIFFLFCAFALLPQPVQATNLITVGNHPRGVVITPDGAYAYVANYGSNTVSVIGTSSNTVTSTITVGSHPWGVAITPDGAYAYVANLLGGSVSVISTSSNTVTSTVTIGGNPLGVAVTPDGAYAYVTNFGSGSVSVISTSSNTVTSTITIGGNCDDVVITPDGAYAYVTNSNGSVSVISTSSNTVIATVTIGSGGWGVAITPDGAYAYVASGSVSVISTSSNTVTSTVTVGSSPMGVAITPNGAYAYVTNDGSGSVSVISTSSNTVTSTVTVGSGPWGVAITPNGAYAYVTNEGSNTVSVISAVPTPTVSISPTSATLDVGQSQLFTATPSGGSGSYTGYQWYVGGSVQSGQTASTFSFTPGSVGSYSITATVTDSSSTTSPQSTAATVTVNASPTVSIAPVGPLTLDVGQVQAFTATPSGGTGTLSYQWYLDGSVVGTNSVSYSYTAAGASHSVTCRVTDSAAAPVTSPASNAVSVTVNASPTVSIAPAGPLTLNVGQSRTFTATPSGGSGMISYQWYLDGSDVGSNSASYSYTSMLGLHSVTCKVTDSAAAPVTSPVSNAVSVTVNSALVAPVISVDKAVIDQGQTAHFSIFTAASGGTTPFSYLWLQRAPSDSFVSTGVTSQAFDFSPDVSVAVGTWSFELQVTDSASTPVVVTSNVISITVAASPTVSIAPVGPLTLDVGQVQAFTATPSGGTGTLSYQWYLDGSVVGTNSVSYSYTAAGASHSVTCRVTDSAAAPVTSPVSNAVSVTVNSALVAPVISVDKAAVDQSQTSSLTSTAVSTGTSPYQYLWLQKAPGAGSYSSISGATSSSYSFVTSGSTTAGSWSFELQVTDAASAVVTSNSVAVTVNVAPTVSVSPGSATLNVGQSQLFTATPSGGSGSYTGYQWYVGGSVQSGQTASTFSFTPGSVGSYSITATVTDSLGVTSPQSTAATVTASVTVTPTPTPSATPQPLTATATSSSGTSITVTAGNSVTCTTTVSGGTGPYKYQWIMCESPNRTLNGLLTGQTSATLHISETVPGIYKFYLLVSDASRQPITSNQVTLTVTQSSSTPSPTPTPTPTPTTTTITAAAFAFTAFDWLIVVIVIIIVFFLIILAWYRRRRKSKAKQNKTGSVTVTPTSMPTAITTPTSPSPTVPEFLANC